MATKRFGRFELAHGRRVFAELQDGRGLVLDGAPWGGGSVTGEMAVVVTGLEVQALSIACRMNGELRQSGVTADMIFPIADAIAYATQVMNLEPGNLLVTGTPPGVGPLRDGDLLEIEVAGIGTLRAKVAA